LGLWYANMYTLAKWFSEQKMHFEKLCFDYY
jgi:hypothetical protein